MRRGASFASLWLHERGRRVPAQRGGDERTPGARNRGPRASKRKSLRWYYQLMRQPPVPELTQFCWIRKLLLPSVTFATPPLAVVKVLP